jgi:hypothetical protein
MPSQLADIYDKDASSDCRFKDGRYRLITTSFDRIFRGSAGPDIARPEGRIEAAEASRALVEKITLPGPEPRRN